MKRFKDILEGDVVRFLPSKTKNTATETHHLEKMKEHAKMQHHHDNIWSNLSRESESIQDPSLKHHYSKLVSIHQEAAQTHNAIKDHHYKEFSKAQRTRAENRKNSGKGS